jgi:secreted Zn-dependent insulinase-like peptidase
MYEVFCKKPENIARFDLPVPNPFIPKNFEILVNTLEAEAKVRADPENHDSAEELTLTQKLHRDHFAAGPGVPVKILSQEGCDAWYKLDTVHRVPKCSMFFEVSHLTKDDEPTAKTQIYQAIFEKIFNFYCKAEMWKGQEFSYDLDFSFNEYTIDITLHCYSDPESYFKYWGLICDKLSIFHSYLSGDASHYELGLKIVANDWGDHEADDADEFADGCLGNIL